MYSHTIHLGRIIHNSLTLLLEINKRVNGKYKNRNKRRNNWRKNNNGRKKRKLEQKRNGRKEKLKE